MTSSHTDPEQLLAAGQTPAPGISRVDEAGRLEAVERLVGGAERGPGGGRRGDSAVRAHAERFIQFSASHGISIDGMWVLRDTEGRIDATALAVPNPGRTAILFTSTPGSEDEAARQAELIDTVCRELAAGDVDLAQVLLEPNDTVTCGCFLAAGFTELAQLSYLERPLPRRSRIPAPRWPEGITVEAFRDEAEADVLAVLDASYEETRDCPGLRGLRRTIDILAGHRGTGAFDPALWTVLRENGRACGVVLLNPAPASNTIELVYIGLARSAQGRGLGRDLLRHALRLVAARAERAVTLAVDEKNEPAIALYRTHGFRRVMRRTALIRSIRPGCPPGITAGGEPVEKKN